MKILFLHQNMPGQFKHLAPNLAQNGKNEVVFITKREAIQIPGVRKLTYQPARKANPSTHQYLRQMEDHVLHGQQAARLCVKLQGEGFTPDLIIAHPGWGESLYVKDVFPNTAVLNYCEFYYQGLDARLEPDWNQSVGLDQLCRLRTRDSHLILALEACDRGWSPTQFQKARHPIDLQDKIRVIFDGIDTNVVKPNPEASFDLPDGRRLTATDEVITYVARNLEPYRGFPTLIRALPKLLERRPRAEVVVVGGDEVSYGSAAPGGKTWREVMLAEVPVDLSRVHFVGRIPYPRYLSLLQVSAVHLYLTVPFVLSWSFLEAMAAGCVIVASNTAPVREVLRPDENGFATDLNDPSKVVDDLDAALESPERERVRRTARDTVQQRYELADCLKAQYELLSETVREGGIRRQRIADAMSPPQPVAKKRTARAG